jgi:hypothetical protein
MLTKTMKCPSCGAGLKVSANLAPGKRIKCPKCAISFTVPDDEDEDRPVSRKAVTTRPRKAAPPPLDDDLPDEVLDRPAPRKPRKKKKKESSKAPLVVGLILGLVVLVGGGITLAVVLSRSKNTDEPNAGTRQPPPSNPGSANMNMTNMGTPNPGTVNTGTLTTGTGTGSTDPASGAFAAGQQVYQAKGCMKCHRIGPGGRGKDLSRVGADPSHTVDWISAHIRDARSHNPRSRMPKYGEDEISAQDLRALSDYLASLK